MNNKIFSTFILSMILIALAATASVAQVTTGTRANNRQTERLLIRIETRIDILKEEADRVADRRADTGAIGDSLIENLAALEQEAIRMRETFDARNAIDDDLSSVLMAATRVDQQMLRNRVSPSAQAQWKSLKAEFNTLAGYQRVTWNWSQRLPPLGGATTGTTYIVTDRQMQTLISRISLKTANYRTQMETALRSDTSADVSDETVWNYILRFEASTNRLKQRFDRRQSTSTDATDVLTTATYIDQYMTRNRLTAAAQAQWRNLRTELNTLASNYRLSWNWNQPMTGDTGGGPVLGNFDRRITGTYRLNTTLSEDAAQVVERALSSSNEANREASRTSLERRLRSPEMIAIEMNNKTVSMASSILPQVTFQADGVARSETNARGRTITTTATVDEDGLIINYAGERANDFYLTFLPTADGKLRVTRKIYFDNSSDGVTVSSVYDKIDNAARWSSVTNSNAGVSGVVEETYIIPVGTRLSAELRTEISGSPVTDRFTMNVTSPGQYRGAVISGRVLAEDAASRVAGRSRVLLAFDTITLPRGKTYRFAGNVDAVTAVNGDLIQVSNQAATVRTTQPTRNAGGILGALIGAIAGVPVDQAGTASATAGAVLSQRGDMIDLGAGSQFMITATVLRAQ